MRVRGGEVRGGEERGGRKRGEEEINLQRYLKRYKKRCPTVPR